MPRRVIAFCDELNSRCRCTDIHTRRLTSCTTSTPGKPLVFSLPAHGGIQKQMVVVNVLCFYIYTFNICVLCNREVWELNPPEVHNAVLQHAAWGRREQQLVRLFVYVIHSFYCFTIFVSPRCFFINSCSLVSPEGFLLLLLQYWLCLHSHSAVCRFSVCSASDLIPAVLHASYTHE